MSCMKNEKYFANLIFLIKLKKKTSVIAQIISY